MKKGNVVTIRDDSYTRSVVGGKLIYEHLAFSSEANKQYIIIETGCSFPAYGSQKMDGGGCCRPSFNNTVIQAIDSGKVVFIEERFLKLVSLTHVVMTDIVFCSGYGVNGQTHEISDELYKQIKKA